MKAKRLLFLVVAICLANGVRAQFYDGPDDIYYYVEYKDGNYVEDGMVWIFNFDGQKGAVLNRDGNTIWPTYLKTIKDKIRLAPSFYENQIENTEYDLSYKYSAGGTTYQSKPYIYDVYQSHRGISLKFKSIYEYQFTSDRNTLYSIQINDCLSDKTSSKSKRMLKRVNKSFFKVGRSRTPSGTMYE